MTASRFALRRLLLAIPVVLGITVLTFALIHLAPGDPIYLLAGDGGSPAYYADMRVKFGLDRPIPEQFARYVGAAFRGDLGYSFTYHTPVSQVIADHTPASLLLGTAALVLSIVGGAGLALLVTIRPLAAFETALRVGCAVVYAAPVFWTGQILILVVAVKAGLLPVGGITSAREDYTGAALWFDVAGHLALPALTLSLPFMAVIARVIRASLRQTMSEPFIQAGAARGLSRLQLVLTHAAPHAGVTLTTLVGQHLPQIVAGAAITEYLFGWPGLGSVVLHASLHRDYPLVTSAFVIVSAAVVCSSAVSDAVCAWIDPRIRYS